MKVRGSGKFLNTPDLDLDGRVSYDSQINTIIYLGVWEHLFTKRHYTSIIVTY